MDDIHRENIRMKLVPHEVVIDDMADRKDMSLQRNAVVLIEKARRPESFIQHRRSLSNGTILNARPW